MKPMDSNKPCIHDAYCGGCMYSGVPYQQQLKTKDQQVRDLLLSYEIDDSVYQGITGCPEGHRLAYRNKMEYTFGDLVKDGEMTLGMHQLGRFLSIITVDHCQLVPEDYNRILRYTLDWAIQGGYTKYHKKRHQGQLRNLIVRRGVRTGELLVNLVTTSEPGLDLASWQEGLLALPLDHTLVGILRTVNDSLSDAVNDQGQELLYGRDYYQETLADLTFQVSPFSFFQTNVEAAERLYREALSLIPGLAGKTVYDLYCGTGTISQIMARSAAQVTGVELVPEAAAKARENAALNGLDNCRFIAGDVFAVLDDLPEVPDVIVVDPPRPGIGIKSVPKIAAYGVAEIL